MITLAIAATFIGFFCFYNTSQKAILFQSTKRERWLRRNPLQAKCCGATALFLALLLSMMDSGIGAGIFTFFILLMAVGSLVVVVAPLKFIHYKSLVAIFLLSLMLELIVYASQ